MSVKIDLTGKRYGLLTVLEIAEDVPGKKKKWRCLCDCGNETVVSGSNLQSGKTKSCGKCSYRSSLAKTHGESRTKLYYVWRAIIDRCERKSAKSYGDYGARGIRVCKEWHDSSTFLKWAHENGYSEGMEIDRKNVDGDYCPENCRWVTREQNANNKRNNRVLEFNGQEKTIAEWARFFGVNYKNLWRDLEKGYSLEAAVRREKSGDRTHIGSKNWRKINENP